MSGIFQTVLMPFVWILMFFYNLFSNYGVALILFALLVKIILFPFSIKGKKGMIQMTAMQGKMQKLQKMYGNNKEKYNLEVQKLYEKEKVNPMSGCLWTMLPLLVLLPLYAIIRQPMTYMMSMSPEAIAQVAAALNWDSVALSMGWINQGVIDSAMKAATDAGQTFVTSFQANAGYHQLYLASLITPDKVSALQDAVGAGAANLFSINFDFLGLNLSQMPSWKIWEWSGPLWANLGLFLLPMVSGATSVVFSKVSMKTNSMNQQTQASNPTNKMMMLMMPLMSIWIGFTMPAGLSIYWVSQNVISLGQEILASKILKKDYEKAAAESAKREAEEKEEEQRQKEIERAERARRIEEQKSGKGKKVPKKAVEEEKIPATVKEASRVGIRAYARGRAYDPARFSPEGPTVYHELNVPLVRQTIEEEELKAEAEELEQIALEQAADEIIVEEILEEQAAEAEDEAEDEADTEEEAEDSDDEDENKKPE